MNTIAPSPQHPLDRSRHAAPQVFEHLRGMIISMALTPGTVLSRAELAAQFGLSQTPIRDALQRLGEESLVDIFPQHATVVRPIEIPLARQAHFLRRSIELEIVHTLAEIQDPALIARLRASLAQQSAQVDSDNYQEFSAADQAFHKLMYEAAKVPDLWILVRRHSGHLDRLRRLHLPIPGKARAILQDHTEIVEAIASGNSALAQQRLRQHLSGTLSTIEEIRARFPTYLKD
jgi:GntR family transcriptional regulator, rspAB operon transcriptional repressor